MKLKEARVENFKCVRDSDSFGVDSKVTCLVGKNESGKTAVLQALYKLNPVVESASKFEETDFPRAFWSEYQEHKAESPANVLTVIWELAPEDKAALADLVGSAAEHIELFTVSKGYNNSRTYSITLDDSDVLKHVIGKHDFNAQERKALNQTGGFVALKEKLASMNPQTPAVQALRAHIEKYFAKNSASLAAIDLLYRRTPKFVYFSEYMRLPGQMSIDDFNVNREKVAHPKANEYRMFEALLGLVNKTAEEIAKIDRFEPLQAELEAVSARLSKTIFKYWSQNKHLLVRFRFDAARAADPVPFNSGWVMRTRIENTRHASTTGFDERSTGFVWFFSFLVWFSQMQKNYGKNLVILLDEPGNSLHAKAQSDLLRYIEEQLAPTYQVIYTTHSPFMIDPSNLLRVRTVEDVIAKDLKGDEELLGTKIGDKVLSTDKDTVFPLQAALGFEITQTLFVGKHTLLVEGPSDLLYIKWFQRYLAKNKKKTLDARWTIAPSGGIDKIAAFMSLFRGSNLHVAVLTDFKHGDKKKIRTLVESRLLADGHIFTADNFAGQPEADIEDILGQEMYCALVNETFSLVNPQVLTPPLPAPAHDARIVPLIEEAFRGFPPTVAEFDHYSPAEHLMISENAHTFPGIGQAVDRFEKLFLALNELLPK